MTPTYTWIIKGFDIIPSFGELENVVSRVHWRLRGSLGLHQAELYGATPVSLPAPEEFTPFGDLTSETVIGWLESAINATSEASNSQHEEGTPYNQEPSVADLKSTLSGILQALAEPEAVAAEVPW